jgi:HTH-type transcriptional regulator, competence development regulator
MKTLGAYLAGGRKAMGLTLRNVESTVGISNAYLSQVENNKIQEPSPVVLQKLSKLYGLSYGECLRLAGYPVPEGTSVPRIVARLGDTTQEEEEELGEYLTFLRRRRLGWNR